MNTDDRALADLIAKLRDWAPGITAVRKDCLEAADAIEALIDRLEAFHAKPVVGEREALERTSAFLRSQFVGTGTHGSTCNLCHSGWAIGEQERHADDCLIATNAAALQSPPPVVSPKVDLSKITDIATLELAMAENAATPPVVEEGRETLRQFARRLDGVPDDTPDIAYLMVDMTHGDGRAIRDAIDAILALAPVEGVGK